MKYKTKDIYFGCVTYNVSKNDFWRTTAEPFLKKDDKYLSLKSKKQLELTEYKKGTNEYLTVSELYPIIDMMKNKSEIPEEISDRLIKLYLIKHKIEKRKYLSTRYITSNITSKTK